MRLRAQEGWTRGDLNLNAAINYVNSYPDPSSLTPRQVGAFTTVDMAVRYSVSNDSLPSLDGLVAAFSVINVFDKRPPYATTGAGTFIGSRSHYDPANASPLGRTIYLSLNKNWLAR